VASDYLLEIDGIKGESSDKGHKGEIEILSWSWGVSNPGTAAGGGGGGTDKPTFQDFSFTKHIDKSSPKLFLACATGEHIKKAVLFVRKQGGEQQEYYKVTLSDILVTQFQQQGQTDQIPVDQFSLNFSKIRVEYRAQSPDGSLEPPVVAEFNRKTSRGEGSGGDPDPTAAAPAG
jgi:type VI secretion system secreted protein Hcp